MEDVLYIHSLAPSATCCHSWRQTKLGLSPCVHVQGYCVVQTWTPCPLFCCVLTWMGATLQTDPGLIEFSSGLLHVHISRTVIIVWYRLDQFAFNPDFGTKEDCGALTETGTGSRLLCCSSFSSAINHCPHIQPARRPNKRGGMWRRPLPDPPWHTVSTRSPSFALQGSGIFSQAH